MLRDRLFSPGPKRILALDGGGIRGAITLGYLKKLEAILRDRHKNHKLVLSDYFDLIGGTSTGAIIAACLAIGSDVDSVIKKYKDIGPKIFAEKNWIVKKIFKSSYDSRPLQEELESIFKKITIGGDEIKTGLCLVTKRIDTGSTWPILNIPGGKYYEKNKGILLRTAVRASTAAPVFFIPEDIDVGENEIGKFVDGGVSMANNPALLMFMVSTLKGFKLNWKTGENELLLVSIGTGFYKLKFNTRDIRTDVVYWGSTLPSSFMYDATLLNQMVLQFLSRSVTQVEIDREIGNMKKDLLTPEPVLTYLRYNVRLEKNFLNDLGIENYDLDSLRKMDKAENQNKLAEIGAAAAKIYLKEEHIPKAFDLSLPSP